MINVDALGLERQDLLCAFLRKKGLTLAQIAKKTGFSPQTIFRLRKAERISPSLYRALVRLGIPTELLPKRRNHMMKIHQKDKNFYRDIFEGGKNGQQQSTS